MKGNLIMKKSLGFTLAEVLITLAIIGVVAAMTIPSVIVNTNQSEFKTGLRKAVSVLNSSDFNKDGNYAFYTTDGMRFEFPTGGTQKFTMHEKTDPQTITFNQRKSDSSYIGECGSFGLASNVNSTNYGPCLIMVDVNGDRKPNPANASSSAQYTWAGPAEKLLKDVFTIMITDEKAVPLGVSAQKAMYQAQK